MRTTLILLAAFALRLCAADADVLAPLRADIAKANAERSEKVHAACERFLATVKPEALPVPELAADPKRSEVEHRDAILRINDGLADVLSMMARGGGYDGDRMASLLLEGKTQGALRDLAAVRAADVTFAPKATHAAPKGGIVKGNP